MSQFRLGFSASDVIKNDTKIWGNLDTIKKWLVQEPIPKLLDEQILIFLTAAGHDVQTAKNIIMSHYHLKRTHPDVFDGRTLDEKMRRNLKAVVTANLPVYHNDSVIFFWKFVEGSVDHYDTKCTLSLLTMNADVSVFNGPVKSAIFLVDGNGMTFKHLMKMKLGLLRTISEYIQNGFPMGLAGIHFINSSFTVKALFKMLSPFINPEMAGLIHFHCSGTDMELFHKKWIPTRCLPREYGGELESVEVYSQALVQRLESLQWFFDAELLQSLRTEMSEVKFGFSAGAIIQAGHVSDDDLQLLKIWQRETDLPQLTDEQLVLFLIATGSSVELCKATIETHFRIKTKTPVLFKDRNVQNEDLRKIARVMHFAVMPERYGASTLFFSGLNDSNYRNLDFACFLRMNCLIVEAILQDNNPQDVIYAVDCRGSTFMHAWKINVHLLKVYFDYIQHGLPCRIKNVHFLHSNRVMHTIYNMFKPWIGQEISSKIILHSSQESTNGFYEWIPKRYLPKEFGGDLESIRVYHERTMKKLTELQFYFDAEQKQWLRD